MLFSQSVGAATTAAPGEPMKTLVIAAALGLSLLLAFALQVGAGSGSTSKASTTKGDCYADGPGPTEPTLCI